jgi:hypothetical protein
MFYAITFRWDVAYVFSLKAAATYITPALRAGFYTIFCKHRCLQKYINISSLVVTALS